MPARSDSLPQDVLNPSAVRWRPNVLIRITGPLRSVTSNTD
jgi:hypothetical protein